MQGHSTELPAGAKQVEGFPNYCVTPEGAVYSRLQQGGGKVRPLVPWHPLRPARKNNRRYLHVTLNRLPDKPQLKFVHQIVLEAFVGPCPPGMECRHLDNNPRNNRLENLCWGTPLENHADKIRHGTTARGEGNGKTTLTESQVRQLRQLVAAGMSRADAARRFHVCWQTVDNICSRRTWKYLT